MRIYNLFPRLAGRFDQWQPHLERAAAMGFDWIFVNPIQLTGRSGSLYSIADYQAIDPRFLDPGSSRSPVEQVRAMTAVARELGLRLMVDLVINHCAIDSPLIEHHPEWLVREGAGVAHPFCVEANGNKVVWEDLAQLDHGATPAGAALLGYCGDVIEWLIDLGFSGFRCDAAYQLPPRVWQALIKRIRHAHPDVIFVAETLGCSPQQTAQTAAAGFDAIFNSAKWWDFESPWLLEQYELTRQVAPSIAFPESHDTARLFAETNGNSNVQKQRYVFTALFCAGVMMPIGYEFGFRKPLHVVETRPEDWEQPAIDLTDFITRVNRIKADYPLFSEETLIQRLTPPNPALLMLWKASTRGHGQALLVINKDPWNRQNFYCEDLYHCIQAAPPLRDVSPEWPLEHLPTPFQFDLEPGMGRVMVTQEA
ncbi:MAG: alpha-amylase [Sphingobacteriia bacterium]|nr:alpha-amylase [Sphingobacteriia bacterium]NCC39363.1 alpha-amylase [Gammaproteobacteria bacterium]